jgi:dienelactone hydrolase
MSNLNVTTEAVTIDFGSDTLTGDLSLVADADGLVLFAHGSGSSRHSPRNRFVAQRLNETGLSTLLIDLLTATEDMADARTGQFRFDISLLAERLTGAVDWLKTNPRTRESAIGLFGASTGAAAALVAAAQRPDAIAAVVSRGGRPDLAGESLRHVTAPTLLIVGSRDPVVLGLNRQAFASLDRAEDSKLEIVHGATHLFEESGALEQVADLAADWFRHRLAGVVSKQTPS